MVPGRKTDRERFAGATSTYSLEAMMGDGKALQMGTSHELGQNFAKAFDIQYTGGRGRPRVRLDDFVGLLDPDDRRSDHVPRRRQRVAPSAAASARPGAGHGGQGHRRVGDHGARALADDLASAGIRVKLDDRVDTPFGRRAVNAELKGIPVRIEVGPRDLAQGHVTLARRFDGSKTPLALGATVSEVGKALEADQKALYEEALARRENATVTVGTLDEAIEAAQTGWARVPWDAVGVDGEAKANESAITVRCLIRPDGSVPASQSEAGLTAILARSY